MAWRHAAWRGISPCMSALRWLPLLALSPFFAFGSARAEGPSVRVHLSATPSNAVLERLDTSVNAFGSVCVAPCDTNVPSGPSYRVGSTMNGASKTFSLTTDATITARLRDGDRATAAWALGLSGGAIFLAGLVSVGLGLIERAHSTRSDPTFFAVGGAMGGVGLGLLIPGLYFLFTNEPAVWVNGVKVARESRRPGWALPSAAIVF